MQYLIGLASPTLEGIAFSAALTPVGARSARTGLQRYAWAVQAPSCSFNLSSPETGPQCIPAPSPALPGPVAVHFDSTGRSAPFRWRPAAVYRRASPAPTSGTNPPE